MMAEQELGAAERDSPLQWELETRLVSLANGAGEVIEGIALAKDAAGSDRATEVLAEIETLAGEYGLVDDVYDAAKCANADLAFASGVLHGVSRLIEAFGEEIHAGDGPVGSKPGEGVPQCDRAGRALRYLQFGLASASVSAVRRRATIEETELGHAYLEGVQYALRRATSTFRVRLERYVSEMMPDRFDSDLKKDLAVLVLVAATDATSTRITESFGESFDGVLPRLRDRNLVEARDETNPYTLRVTKAGANEVFRILRDELAA